MIERNSYEVIVRHWSTLLDMLEQGRMHEASRYVEASLHAPVADDGLGQLGYRLSSLVTFGFLPINANPALWSVDQNVAIEGTIDLDETRQQEITARKQMKIKSHTLRRYIMDESARLAKASVAPSSAHITNETNRRLNSTLAALPAKMRPKAKSEDEKAFHSALKAQVIDDLTPSHDSMVNEIARLTFACAVYYRFNVDVSASEIRGYLGTYHDGFWADQVINQAVKLTLTDSGQTVESYAARLLEKGKAVKEATSAKSAEKVAV